MDFLYKSSFFFVIILVYISQNKEYNTGNQSRKTISQQGSRKVHGAIFAASFSKVRIDRLCQGGFAGAASE